MSLYRTTLIFVPRGGVVLIVRKMRRSFPSTEYKEGGFRVLEPGESAQTSRSACRGDGDLTTLSFDRIILGLTALGNGGEVADLRLFLQEVAAVLFRLRLQRYIWWQRTD